MPEVDFITLKNALVAALEEHDESRRRSVHTPGPHTLQEPSRIRLFGQQFKGLTFDRDAFKEHLPDHLPDPPPDPPDRETWRFGGQAQDTPLPIPPGRWNRQLMRDLRVAHIFSFSYRGHYYALRASVLLLVRGEGASIDENFADKELGALFSQTGLPGKDWQFHRDIRVWLMDQKEMSALMTLEIDNLERLLLEPSFSFEEQMSSRGAAAGRGAASGRGAAAGRGAAVTRGAAASRGAMIGPHQDDW